TKELTKKIRMSAPSDGRSDSSTIPNSATQRYAMRNRSTSTMRTATAIGLHSAPAAAARTVRGSLFHRAYPARPVATTNRKRIRNVERGEDDGDTFLVDHDKDCNANPGPDDNYLLVIPVFKH